MRPVAATLATLMIVVPLTACSGGSVTVSDDGKPGIAATGSGGERHYAVSNFDKLVLAASGNAEVRTGQSFGLTVTGDPAALDTLKVTQDGETLSLGRKSGVHWTGPSKIHWVVTLPRLGEATIGGSGSIHVDRVEGGDFEGSIGGSGDLDIAAMKVGKASFNIGGSGNVTAAGTAQSLDLSIGGSGKIRAAGLAAQTAEVSIAGAGDVQATVHGKAEVNILGSGDVTIGGGAKCDVSKMGAGNVHCS